MLPWIGRNKNGVKLMEAFVKNILVTGICAFGCFSSQAADQAGCGINPAPGAAATQSFMLFAAAVPEPTTILSGALLALPLGIAVYRQFRKRGGNDDGN